MASMDNTDYPITVCLQEKISPIHSTDIQQQKTSLSPSFSEFPGEMWTGDGNAITKIDHRSGPHLQTVPGGPHFPAASIHYTRFELEIADPPKVRSRLYVMAIINTLFVCL